MATFSPNPIDEYKRRLSYGARGNLFLVQFSIPDAITEYLQGDQSIDELEREVSIMADQAVLPTPRTITPTSIPVQGEYFKVPGEKADVADVSFTYKNTEDFKTRNLFESWLELVQTGRVLTESNSIVVGTRRIPTDYVANIKIAQLDHNREVVKKVELVNAWCSSIGEAVQLDQASADITTTTVNISYDYHRNIANEI